MLHLTKLENEFCDEFFRTYYFIAFAASFTFLDACTDWVTMWLKVNQTNFHKKYACLDVCNEWKCSLSWIFHSSQWISALQTTFEFVVLKIMDIPALKNWTEFNLKNQRFCVFSSPDIEFPVCWTFTIKKNLNLATNNHSWLHFKNPRCLPCNAMPLISLLHSGFTESFLIKLGQNRFFWKALAAQYVLAYFFVSKFPPTMVFVCS